MLADHPVAHGEADEQEARLQPDLQRARLLGPPLAVKPGQNRRAGYTGEVADEDDLVGQRR